MEHEFVGRSGWGARPPTGTIPPATYPETRTVLHHEGAGSPPAVDRQAEIAYMRRLQATMQANGYADIAYSAVVMPSGRLYEGRDLGGEDAATAGQNPTSISMLLPANCDVWRPTVAQIHAAAWLIRLARWFGMLTVTSDLVPHSAVRPTACPGRWGREIIPAINTLVTNPPTEVPTVMAQFDPPLQIVSWCTFRHATHGQAVAAVAADGAVFCEPSAAYVGGANGKPYFRGRRAARIVATAGGYEIVATSGERYRYPE
jgi:hypothetical protein